MVSTNGTCWFWNKANWTGCRSQLSGLAAVPATRPMLCCRQTSLLTANIRCQSCFFFSAKFCWNRPACRRWLRSINARSGPFIWSCAVMNSVWPGSAWCFSNWAVSRLITGVLHPGNVSGKSVSTVFRPSCFATGSIIGAIYGRAGITIGHRRQSRWAGMKPGLGLSHDP